MGQRFLIDTNILIYYFDNLIPQKSIEFVDDIFYQSYNISVISKIEFLGWQKYTEDQYRRALEILKGASIFGLTDKVAKKTVRLKRRNHIKTPDAIIIATCLVHDLTLTTRNKKDFEGIEGLTIYNPFTGMERSDCR